MLLYINGEEISGGACCVNNFVQSSDDIRHTASGNKPHPENVMHSVGYYLSRLYQLGFRCESSIKKSNEEIYNSVEKFVTEILPQLKSNYTIICVGWKSAADAELLNKLAALIDSKGLDRIFFNVSAPLPKRADIQFENCIDLLDPDECFVKWCKNNNHILKNEKYPDAQAHNAWAKYIFNKSIKNS